MNDAKFPCLLAFMILLAGCVTSPTAALKKAGIRSVQIEPRVDARQGMRYGVDLSSGGLANALASMIVDSAGQKGVTRMTEVMQNHRIVVPEIVRQHAILKLGEIKDLNIVEGDADAVLVFSIVQYGFDSPGLKFSKKCPIIVVRAELRDRKDKRVWSKQNSPMQLTSEGIGATWDEYEAQPEKLREDWARQIDYVTGIILKP